jgi:hypothetical protein
MMPAQKLGIDTRKIAPETIVRSGRQCDQARQQGGGQHDLGRDGKAFHDEVEDGFPGTYRDAQVAVQQLAGPAGELVRQRLVEAELGAHFLRQRRVARVAQHQADRVARNQADHGEHQQRHDERRGNRHQDAFCDIRQHGNPIVC